MFQETAHLTPEGVAYAPSGKTWIILTDGNRARVYETFGRSAGIGPAFPCDFYGSSGRFGDAPVRKTFDPEALQRSASGTLPAVHAPRESFAKALAAALETSLDHECFDRLVLVAPPQVLGDLTGTLSRRVRQTIAAEVSRDLMHVAPCELPIYLGSALPE